MSYLSKVVDMFGMSYTKIVTTLLTSHFGLSTTQCPISEEDISQMKKISYVIYHTRLKHIEVRNHKICELVNFRDISLEKIYTKENATNILMKVVTLKKFKYCLNTIHVVGTL
ncbi:unnamed protein product [Spirodela intermedia]|uniref:Uncharacterized protein n=1 Tax=Spirodela intermedia TaxID=51605 RepID=A0A7I8ICQ1_SPIIN|nr:unnamed protein product [Spirodela intermedia]CAA6654822.1 unnamed protein product [Spirodela intermedia]